ncbi:MAG: hypothetical protein KME26_24850 [Oscillatoria princeps RMCB-10]|jgi:uncharacterized coiled-coil protein SlyX|nr:hypothetical protein [Oscillatoria princeps RMCB-10]
MSDLEREVAFLATRVLQLETQQIALKKAIAELEFRLDVLTDRFNSRSGETPPANFAQALERLRRQIAQLQERVNLAGSGSDSLESAGTLKEPASKNNVAFGSAGDEESVRLGIDGSDHPTVLEWAAEEGRVLLTHDVATITQYAYQRVEAGQSMPGVFEVSLSIPIGRAI